MIPAAAELDRLLAEMRGAATAAGRLLLDGLRQPKSIRHKGAVDLVTEHDLRAERLIRDHLTASVPEMTLANRR